MSIEVLGTDEFRDWYGDLPVAAQERVTFVVDLLEEKGTRLGFPYTSAIQGTSLPLRELRVQHMGEPIRILYIFDPLRQALLLLGGSKLGTGNRWYQTSIRRAEQLYEEYLRDM